MTIAIPQGYGKLVRAALARPLYANYDGEHGVTFFAKPRLFGMALSSYQALPSTDPAMVVVCFVVGAFSLRAARRELLTWALVAKGSERVLNEYLTQKEFGLEPEPSPLTELPPELMVRLDFDPAKAVKVDYRMAGASD